MNSQQQLLLPDASRLDLASPVFKSKPGWGGKLNIWLHRNFTGKILPWVLGVMGITGIYLITQSRPAIAPREHIDNMIRTQSIQTTANPGKGITHLARQALRIYLSENPDIVLFPEQKIYIEDYLKDLVGSQILTSGDMVEFQVSDIKKVIEKAKALKDWQIANLTKYAIQVKEL